MANDYQLARDQRKAQGSATMNIEPMRPGDVVKDLTKPEPHSETLLPPKKPGMPEAGIKPLPIPNPNKHSRVIPAHPGDIDRPKQSDIMKT